MLERVDVGPDPHPVTAEAVVVEEDGRWSMALEIEGIGGTDRRTLRGES